MSEDFEQEVPEAPEYPAMEKSGRSPTWERIKYVAKSTAMLALKGAVIGGLALAAIALPFGGIAAVIQGAPILGWVATPVMETLGIAASNWLLGALASGAMLGGIAGAMIGTSQGFGGVDDAMDDMEQSIVTREQRARQLAANQQTFAMGMERLRGSQQGMGGMMPAQQQLPYGANMGVGRGN